MLTLLTIIAMSYTTATRTEMAMYTAARTAAQARAAAEAGIWKGISKLTTGDPELQWDADGTIYPLEFRDNTVRISIQDQSGLIDLNQASPEMLSALVTNVLPELDTPEELVDQIIDWRDSDSKTEPYGAEDIDYQNADLDYEAKDGPFNNVEELQQLLAFTRETYAAIAPLVTAYSGKAEINIKTAPREVIEVIPDMSDAQADEILEARETGDFKAALTSLSATQRPHLGNVRSQVFEVRAEAEVGKSRVSLGAVVLIAPMGRRPYTVLSWNDPAAPLPADGLNEDELADDDLSLSPVEANER